MRCPWYRNDPSAAAIAGRGYAVVPDAGPVLGSELRGRRRSLRALPRARRPQRAQHRSRARGAVQRVEMDARRPARQKLVALPGRVRNAQQRLGLGVPAERVHRPRELLGNGRIAAVAEANDLVEARDRNHARDDRDTDSGLAGGADEVEVETVVEEELRDEKARAGVDLRLQVGEVGLQIGRLGMDFRKAGAADREVVALGDEARELGGAGEPALRGTEGGLAPRRIAPEREHVLDPRLVEPIEDLDEALLRLPDAAQVRHRLEPVLLLDPVGDLNRAVTRRAARPVGDRDVVGRERLQGLDGLEQVLDLLGSLRWEELNREDGFGSGENLIDAHGAGW